MLQFTFFKMILMGLALGLLIDGLSRLRQRKLELRKLSQSDKNREVQKKNLPRMLEISK